MSPSARSAVQGKVGEWAERGAESEGVPHCYDDTALVAFIERSAKLMEWCSDGVEDYPRA